MSIRDDDFSREDRGRRALKDGEWACPDAKCAQVNAERITHCEGCGKYKPTAKSRVGKEIGKEMAEKSKGLFAAEDWVCSKCGNVNWARRKSCNVCNAPKLADLEKRTGYGGGYMDRQDVEYVKRDYDEEFDEFGRKKKRVSEGRGKNSPDGSDEEDDDDDGELIGENLSKYKLDDEAEDEEEDEDDEDDLGKYDLTADPDLVEKRIEIVKQKKVEESDCSCSCSGGECSCEESECEKEKEHDRARDRGKVHKSSRERDRERDERHRRRSQSKDRKRSRSRDRKRSRSRERRRSRSREKRRSRERRDRSRDRKRSRTRSRERKRDREERRRSRSRERRR